MNNAEKSCSKTCCPGYTASAEDSPSSQRAIDLKITRPWTRFNWGTLKADIDLNALSLHSRLLGKRLQAFISVKRSTRVGEVVKQNTAYKDTTERKRKLASVTEKCLGEAI